MKPKSQTRVRSSPHSRREVPAAGQTVKSVSASDEDTTLAPSVMTWLGNAREDWGFSPCLEVSVSQATVAVSFCEGLVQSR